MSERNTTTERRAVEELGRRIAEHNERTGARVDHEAARRKAIQIAERSDAERRDGKRK